MSNFRVALTTNGTLLLEAEDCAAQVCASIKEKISRRPEYFPKHHSKAYYRKQLNCHRGMPLSIFIYFLFVLRKFGNLFGEKIGQAWVKRILQIIADRFDLDVVPRRPQVPLKDLPLEELDIHRSVGHLSETVVRVYADRIITAKERAELDEAVLDLQREAEDVRAIR